MTKYFSIVSICIGAFVFCASAFSLPAWVENPHDDNDEAIYGVGSGESFKEAKRSALTDIASKFNTKVQETYVAQHRQFNDQTEMAVNIDSRSEVLNTQLNHFQITQSVKEGELYWVEARLDKKAFAEEIHQRWTRLDASIASEMTALKEAAVLQQLVQLPLLAAKIHDLELIVAQLSFAQRRFDAAPHYERYIGYLEQLQSLKNRHIVYLDQTTKGDDVFNLLKEILSKNGLIVTTKESARAEGAVISVRTKRSEEQDERKAYTVNLEVVVTSADVNGKTLGAATYRARGRSYADSGAATEKAIAALKVQLSRLSLPQLLNITP